jgi:uncharacterized protein DUF6939
MSIRVIGMRDGRRPAAAMGTVIDTTSQAAGWSRGLSPFLLGPVAVPNSPQAPVAENVENAWQYSKVYQEHVDNNGNPTLDWYAWRAGGFRMPRAVRYPMGKNRVPLYSMWNCEKLDYVQARRKIYIPCYVAAARVTLAYSQLVSIYRLHGGVTLYDFDSYDHKKLGMSYEDVINSTTRKMGHSFVLAMMLEGIL